MAPYINDRETQAAVKQSKSPVMAQAEQAGATYEVPSSPAQAAASPALSSSRSATASPVAVRHPKTPLKRRNGSTEAVLGSSRGSSRRSSRVSKTTAKKSASPATKPRTPTISPAYRKFLARLPTPPTYSEMMTDNGAMGWQIRMSHHLAMTGKNGPFEVGDYLCEVNVRTGNLVRIAIRDYDDKDGQGWKWKGLLSKKHISMEITVDDGCGAPVWGPDGSFRGFAGTGKKGLKTPPVFLPKADRSARFRMEDDKSPWMTNADPMLN